MMTILLMNSAMAWEIQTTEGGAEYHWPVMPLDYVWLDDGAPDELTRVSDAINASFEAWAAVPEAFIDVERAAAAGAIAEVALDEDHVVFFERDWPVGSEALAVATTWADELGRVVSFDVRINARAAWSTTGDEDAFDLQAAMTHEVGHVLGLEHTIVDDATMFASHDLGEDWRQILHEDDQAAVQYLYGEAALTEEGGGPGLGCATLGGTSWTLVLGLLPLTLIRRKEVTSC